MLWNNIQHYSLQKSACSADGGWTDRASRGPEVNAMGPDDWGSPR